MSFSHSLRRQDGAQLHRAGSCYFTKIASDIFFKPQSCRTLLSLLKQFPFNRKRVNLIDTKLALSGNDKLRCPKEECIFDGKRKKAREESRPKRVRHRAKPTHNKRTVVHRILCMVELGITFIITFFCFKKKLPL